MKAKSIIMTVGLAFAATLAVAIGISASNKTVKEMKPAEARQANEKIVYRFSNNFNWGAVYCHAYNSESDKAAAWPGVQMVWAYNNEYNQGIFTAYFDKEYDYVIFNNNNGAQTVDITVGSDIAWYPESSQDGSGHYYAGHWNTKNKEFFLYDYNNTFTTPTAHMWRENGNNDFGLTDWPGISLTAETNSSGRFYKIEADEMCDRVIFSNNGSNQTSDLIPTNEYVYKLDESDWWDNKNYALAHDWAMNLMHMRDYDSSLSGNGTGECLSYYPIAKAAYDTYDQFVVGEINNNFANAVARFNTWASIYSSSTNNALLGLELVVNNKNSTALIITFSIIAVGSASGFFYIRKKRLSK